MDKFRAFIKYIVENWHKIISAIIALLTAIIVISLMIPGPEPERTLQKIVNFLTLISVK